MKHYFAIAAAVLAAAIVVCGNVTALEISAQSAALLDCGSGRLLYEKKSDTPNLLASTTKIMTALLICERCDPDSRVRISPEATGIEGSSVYLKAGEILTVQDLLYCMMLHSGNDAA
ncbi:MAG: serine hydrolase, partial [Oscillospiraceae bacterium]|nr:serine hydrolase [Oscillospiraceae bacterium]